MGEMRKRQRQGKEVRLAWVKAYVGIPGNERADVQAKFYTMVVRQEVLTEGNQVTAVSPEKDRARTGGLGKGESGEVVIKGLAPGNWEGG